VESEPTKSGDVGKKNVKKKGVSDWVVLLGGNFGCSRDHHVLLLLFKKTK